MVASDQRHKRVLVPGAQALEQEHVGVGRV